MQQLHLVGFTTDLEGLIVSPRKGSRSGGYFIRIDGQLLESIDDAQRLLNERDAGERDEREGDRVEELRPRPRPRSELNPREIQARLRAGASIAEVADEAAVDEDWVRRFADPILAEQARVVQQAQQLSLEKARVGLSSQPLGAAVRWNLADRGVGLPDDVYEAGWSAFNLHGTRWVVRFSFSERGRRKAAVWEVDLREGELTHRNRLAADLGYVQPGRRRPRIPEPDATGSTTPAPRRRPAKAGRGRASTRKASRPRAKAGKAPARKTVAKKATGRKTSPPRAPAAKTSTAKTSTAKARAAKKSRGKKAAARKKAPGKRSGAKKSAVAEAPAVKMTGAERPTHLARPASPMNAVSRGADVTPTSATRSSAWPLPSGAKAARAQPARKAQPARAQPARRQASNSQPAKQSANSQPAVRTNNRVASKARKAQPTNNQPAHNQLAERSTPAPPPQKVQAGAKRQAPAVVILSESEAAARRSQLGRRAQSRPAIHATQAGSPASPGSAER